MTPSLRDSKWLPAAVIAVAGFAVLVLLLSRMEVHLEQERQTSAENDGELARKAASTLTSAMTNEAAAAPDAQENIDESGTTSIEEQIRKKYGMVKLAGVWLPVMPLQAGSGAASGSVSEGDGAGARFAVPLYISTGKLPQGRAGEDYRARIEAVGGVPPYSWSLDRGTLMEPIILSRADGELTGTPNAAAEATIRIRVTDAAGAADVAEYRLRIVAEDSLIEGNGAARPAVAAVNQAEAAAVMKVDSQSAANAEPDGVTETETEPKADTTEDPAETRIPLVIASNPLAEAKVGESYAVAFTASGGRPPYSWSAQAALPAGLMLDANGNLGGMPEQPGEFMLAVMVTDQDGQIAARSFMLSIRAAELAGVTDFTAFVSLRRVAFKWSNPADARFQAVRILRNSARPPVNETDGVPIYEGAGVAAVDSSAPPGPHYYAAFGFDVDGGASAPAHLAVTLRADADPFAKEVLERQLLNAQAYNQALLPGIVLGAPRGGGVGAGSSHVVSFGAAATNQPGGAPYGGSMVLGFGGQVVHDGPGADFTISENVFYVMIAPGVTDPNTRMMEPAIVSVSQDGVSWHTFPFDFSPRYDAKTGELNLRHPFVYNKGFAGVNPVIANGANVDATDPLVSGGDSFDLADLQVPGLSWIRYIRIQSTGHLWLTDADGEMVHHPNGKDTREADRTFNKSGFDLDAVTAIWLDVVR